MARYLVAGLTLTLAFSTPIDTAVSACAPSSHLKALERRITRLGARDAELALEAYMADAGNDLPCDATKLEDFLDRAELALARLRVGEAVLPPAQVYRCAEIAGPAQKCGDDLTAVPDRLAVPKAPPAKATLASPSGYRLKGAYWGLPGALQDGGPAAPLRIEGDTIDTGPIATGGALIVVFETTGRWRYRKYVWYF
jgi:hypothetical protein